MKHLYILIFILIYSPSILFSQNKTGDIINEQYAKVLMNKNDGEILKDLGQHSLNISDFNHAVLYSKKLMELGEKTGNENYQMYGSVYLGQALMMKGYKHSAKVYLERSQKLALKLKNDSVLSSVYNGLGLYAVNIESDYYSSISYYMKGIKSAKRSKYKRLYSILLCNMGEVYYLKKDTTGLKYTLECYELGHKQNDPFIIYAGAVNTSQIYFLKKKYDKVLMYLREAEFLMDKNKFYDQTNVYTLFGRTLFYMGDDIQAESYYNKAIKYAKSANVSSLSNCYINYADLLMKNRRYKEAADLLNSGITLCNKKSNTMFLYQLYESLSKCYELENNYKESLKYYKIYHQESGKQFNAEKERSLNELKVKYDTEKQGNEIKQNKLELLQKEGKINLLIFILSLAVTVLGGLYYLYHRKNKLYLNIVRQNQEAIKREKNLYLQIKQLQGEENKLELSEKYSVSSLTDEKSSTLYKELETLMREKQVYKDNFLTKEKLAEMLGTNRTYLSQIINEKYGSSFTYYINSYRIDEAIHVLSDPDNTIPLKALSAQLGFNSISTFYKVFQLAVGMPPSLYRSKVIELQKTS